MCIQINVCLKCICIFFFFFFFKEVGQKMSASLTHMFLTASRKCEWPCRIKQIVFCSPLLWGYVFIWKGKGKGERGSGVWPSMVTHTRNLSSAFNPSKCTLTAVNTHPEQWAAMLRRPGSSWGIGALLKGLTSVVVLKVERTLVIHSPHRQSLPDLGIEPATFGLQVQLSNH